MKGELANRVNLALFLINANIPLLMGRWGGKVWLLAVLLSTLLLALENYLVWRKGVHGRISYLFSLLQSGVLFAQWRCLT